MKTITNQQKTLDAVAEGIASTNDPALVDGNESFNYEKEQAKILGQPEDTTQFQDIINTIVDKVRETGKPVDQQTGHSILSADEYKGMTPDIQVTKRNTGFSSAETAQEFRVNDPLKGVSKNPNQPVRTANDVDLSKIDETMVMDLPFIAVTEFKLIDSLNLKPKDPGTRFRWVNYKNFVAGNMGRYVALGFEPASIDDVNTKETPVDNSMVDGSTVKYYDIQLFKIHVLKLMALYKKNIIQSLGRIRNFQEAGKAAAEKQFNDDITSNPQLMAGLHKMRIANNGEAPIEFYKPE